ncbi:PREDICTED: extracellular calcium-sensing receptor-like [Nanorana parkeri]|uniref:extracellular calcium-sensing receptor-like n=1 Tax=Nanorana parkeri TaxID=125878 RepID=UPI000853F8D5|nr:PREDICTED: extracellular calcium-sensing receptor-like [Nanorana parkeri]
MSFRQKPGPIICKDFLLDRYLQLQTFRYAVKEINSDPRILSNITLGFRFYDPCRALQKELQGTLCMLSGQNKAIPNFQCQQKERLAAIIGHSTSTYSIIMAHILGLTRYPQISYLSTSHLLSDRTQFPSFFRTVPSDVFQSQGLAHLVLHFGWTWVGLIAFDNDYGFHGIRILQQNILRLGVCVEFIVYIQSSRPDRNMPHIIQTIKKSTAKAVVIFAPEAELIFLFNGLIKPNVTGKTWVASEAWATSSILLNENKWEILLGTVGFAFHSDYFEGFHELFNRIKFSNESVDTLNNMFLEGNIGCEFKEFQNVTFQREKPPRTCTLEEKIKNLRIGMSNVTNLRSLYYLYCAVKVIAQALHDLSMCKKGNGTFINRSCSGISNFRPWQMLHYMKNVRVNLSDGAELFFDYNGDPPPVYDIVNWQQGQDGVMRQIKVGSYRSSSVGKHTLTLNTNALQWSSGSPAVPVSVCSENCPSGFRIALIKGQPSCCIQCIPCSHGEFSNKTNSADCFQCPWNEWPSPENDRCLPKPIEYLTFQEPLGITLACTSVTSSFVPLAILWLFIHYKTTPVVRANNYNISCLLLISLSLCFLCSLAFIGYPQRQKCLLRQVAFGMVFALCVSCILAKTMMVMIAFRATKPNSNFRKLANPSFSYKVISLGTFVQSLICTFWLLFFPPYPQYNNKVKPEILVLECNEGSLIAFWCTLGYLGVLAIFSFLVAFLARQLPDNFNEAKYITFSMLAFLSVWLTFIPAHLSITTKYTVATEIFAILSSTWAMLGCMFVPKCYIILLRPNVTSKKLLIKTSDNKE